MNRKKESNYNMWIMKSLKGSYWRPAKTLNREQSYKSLRRVRADWSQDSMWRKIGTPCSNWISDAMPNHWAPTNTSRPTGRRTPKTGDPSTTPATPACSRTRATRWTPSLAETWSRVTNWLLTTQHFLTNPWNPSNVAVKVLTAEDWYKQEKKRLSNNKELTL